MKHLLGCALAMGLLSASWGQACTTPVYRYALYNWAAEPYRVFYFYRGGPRKEDEAVNKRIAELAQATPPTVNLALESIDLDQRPLEQLPEPIRKVWESRQDQSLPKHLIVAPWGVEIFSGRLDLPAIEAMIESPVRTRLAQMLDSGQVAVLVLLTGKEEAENERAAKVAAEVIKQAAAGELPGENEPGSDTAQGDVKPRRWDLGLIKLSHEDPAEQWLLRALTTVEPDLREKQLAEQPMVFAVYGRGRAMPPYVGKGITPENLTEMVLFLSGACSCQVKDQNPGVDLLVQWDWEATATRLAANEDSQAVQSEYMEFAVNSPEKSATDEREKAVEPSEGPKAQRPVPASGGLPLADKPVVAAIKATLPADAEGSSASRSMRRLGIGFGAIAAAVVLIGLLVIRKRTGNP
ncbi:MAG: hypothetical protein ABFD16_20105 [Thermoguttaceae bacterium]|jgi:hypothetical protein